MFLLRHLNSSLSDFDKKLQWYIDNGYLPTPFTVVALVPVMTSATSPSGQVFAKDNYTGEEPYKAFDGNDSTHCGSNTTTTPWWVGYKFDSPVCVKSFRILHRDGNAYNTAYKLQGSNDGTNYTDLGSYTNNSANADLKHSVDNNNSYLYYRVYMTANAGSGNGAKTIQFYGSK